VNHIAIDTGKIATGGANPRRTAEMIVVRPGRGRLDAMSGPVP
jgi:hypothetical protein